MEEKSKTQKKKEALSLQKLGERLVGLSGELISDMNLPEELQEAVMAAKTIKKHGARKRQMQYIGLLMRKHDPSPVREALYNLDSGNERKAAEFQELERWRDELIRGNEKVLDEVVKNFSHADRQHLSRLIRQAQKEIRESKPPKASRALFRYLRDVREGSHPE